MFIQGYCLSEILRYSSAISDLVIFTERNTLEDQLQVKVVCKNKQGNEGRKDANQMPGRHAVLHKTSNYYTLENDTKKT